MFKDTNFLGDLVKEAGSVCLRRFVISAPRDNYTEPFKFSSRHSEFVRLKAKALLANGGSDEDELRRYKVVI